MISNRTKLIIIICIYGLVSTISNLIGTQIPSTFAPEVILTDGDMLLWSDFLAQHNLVVLVVNIFTFVIPCFICVSYISFCPRERFESHIINLPLAYSLSGISGWLFYYIFEILFLFYAKTKIGLHILTILSSSTFYITMECLFSFTMAYFIMETIHRRYVLPTFFGDGNLKQYKGLNNISLNGLFTIFYVSTGLFPVLYVLFAYFSVLKQNNLSIEINPMIVLAAIIIMEIVITIIFTDYFSTPLKKLKKATEQIKNGNYGEKVNFVSNDAFGDLSDAFNDMSDSLKMQLQKINSMQNSIIRGMATMVESRDNSTGGHIMRTSTCMLVFSESLKKHTEYGKLPEKFYENLAKAAPMHDLGKIAVDDAVLRKPGKFTDEEYEKMKSHSAEGARIVTKVLEDVDDEDFKQIAVNVAHYHHEKWNGSGYPTKISGEQIPLEARIMALVDVFDALVSKRCYKDSFDYDKAFSIIEESLGSHFDPQLGKEFLNCRPELEKLYNQFKSSEN